jgi:CO/xanthine dehydrogenase FAD-binding subunit
MAGGTDLLVQLRGDRFEIDALVDIKGIPELDELSLATDGLTIGAAVPCYRIYEDPAIAKAYPGLIDAASIIGGIQIQSRASLGGNLCNATPSADGICPLIVHSATATLSGVDGTRSVPIEEFCTGPGQNIIGYGEMLVSIIAPKQPTRSGAAYQRFTPRNEMDIAVAGVGASVVLDASGERIASARIALAAVGPTPIVATAAADSLVGKAPTDEAFAQAAALASAAATPITDMRGTVDQRKQLVDVLTRRTLTAAAARARENA